MTPGKSYTLSFVIGRLAGAVNPNLNVRILVDGVLGASWENIEDVAQGGQERRQVTYTHPVTSLPGSSLDIVFDNTAFGAFYVTVDDVHLHETDGFTSISDNFLSGFEPHTAGMSLGGANFFEGWEADMTSAASTLVLPDGANVTGPQMGLPTQGSQWAELSNLGTGAASVTPEAITYLVFYAESKHITFDWNFGTSEGINDPTYIDTARCGLYDFSNIAVNPVLQFETPLASTADVNLPWVASASSSGHGFNFANELSALQTTTITIPDALVGKRCVLQFNVVNGADSSFASSLMVDNVRFERAVFRPGTGEGFNIATGCVDSVSGGLNDWGELSGGPGNDRKYAELFDTVQVAWYDDSMTFVNYPVVLLAEILPTDVYPAGFPAFGFHLSVGNSFILENGLEPSILGPLAWVTPTPQVRNYFLPLGLGGKTVLLQAVCAAGIAANGAIATSDRHEIVLP
ncbi:MAG: hypothetical protein R3F20_16585 [Planctomycetota bacterium]